MEALVGNRIRPLTALSPDLSDHEPERSPASNDGLQMLKQIFDSVRKYRRLVLTMTIVGPLLLAAFSLFMSPSYLATAQLAVDARQSGGGDAGTNGPAAAPAAGAEEAAIDTHVTVLLSDAYLRRLLPALSALDDARNNSRPATWSKRLGTFLGNAWSTTKDLIFFKKHEFERRRGTCRPKAQPEGWPGTPLQDHQRYRYQLRSAACGRNCQYGRAIVCR